MRGPRLEWFSVAISVFVTIHEWAIRGRKIQFFTEISFVNKYDFTTDIPGPIKSPT